MSLREKTGLTLAALAFAAAGAFITTSFSPAHSARTPEASISKPIMQCPDPDATTWPCR